MLLFLFNLILQVDIEEKLKNAPDGSYQIGVIIGALLPFFVLVVIAYLLYFYFKKKKGE